MGMPPWARAAAEPRRALWAAMPAVGTPASARVRRIMRMNSPVERVAARSVLAVRGAQSHEP